MKTLKIVAIVLVTLVVVFVLVGLWLPKEFKIERTTRVQAPVELVFDQVNDLKNWEKWSPWFSVDPTMAVTYSDKTAGSGSSYSWTGESAGSGTLQITKSLLAQRIETQMDFGEMGTAQGFWDFSYQDRVTSVTWGFEGENSGVFGGWFTVMMDGMVGPQFEAGLQALKTVAEATPIPAARQEENTQEGEAPASEEPPDVAPTGDASDPAHGSGGGEEVSPASAVGGEPGSDPEASNSAP
jgi:hypothetical protein